MAASDDEFDDSGKGKLVVKEPTEEVKNTVKEDKGGGGSSSSVRDKTKELAGKGHEKIVAPVMASAKDKLEKVEGKRPAVQAQAIEMLDQAKHTVGRVVQKESKDVVEGMKRLAQDEKAFHEAAHKVTEKLTGNSQGTKGTSSGKDEHHDDDYHREQEHHQEEEQEQQQQRQQGHRQGHEFSDFSEMEFSDDDEGEGSSHHPKKRLLDHQQHQEPGEHKQKKSPLGFFKFGAKHKGKKDQKQDEKQHDQSGVAGALGAVRSALGEGSSGQSSYDMASGLAQKKLAQMRHVVDAKMDEAGNATAAEKKNQGVGLVQSFGKEEHFHMLSSSS